METKYKRHELSYSSGVPLAVQHVVWTTDGFLLLLNNTTTDGRVVVAAAIIIAR